MKPSNLEIYSWVMTSVLVVSKLNGYIECNWFVALSPLILVYIFCFVIVFLSLCQHFSDRLRKIINSMRHKNLKDE